MHQPNPTHHRTFTTASAQSGIAITSRLCVRAQDVETFREGAASAFNGCGIGADVATLSRLAQQDARDDGAAAAFSGRYVVYSDDLGELAVLGAREGLRLEVAPAEGDILAVSPILQVRRERCHLFGVHCHVRVHCRLGGIVMYGTLIFRVHCGMGCIVLWGQMTASPA